MTIGFPDVMRSWGELSVMINVSPLMFVEVDRRYRLIEKYLGNRGMIVTCGGSLELVTTEALSKVELLIFRDDNYRDVCTTLITELTEESLPLVGDFIVVAVLSQRRVLIIDRIA